MPFTKIEVKHIYQNSGYYVSDGSYLPLKFSNNSSTNVTLPAPDNVHQQNISCKVWTLPVPAEGTGEDERVGNKISPQSYHCDLVISPYDYNDYLPNMFNKLFLGGGGIQSETNYLLTKSKYRMRLMVIDFFDDPNFKIPDQFVSNIHNASNNDDYNTVCDNLTNWYQTTYVPTGRLDISNVSCSQKMLRESTPYTGTFKVYYDKLIKLSPKNHFSKRVGIDLNLSRYKDFNISNGRYTKHNILFVLFNCMAPTLDMDPVLYKLLNSAYTEDNSQDHVNYRNTYSISIGFTGKLKYLDF